MLGRKKVGNTRGNYYCAHDPALDHEIFRLKDEIEYYEGENATFYSTLLILSYA